MLPSDCATSVGPGDDAKTNYLIDCGDGPDEDTSHSPATGGSRPRSRAARPRPARKQSRTALAVQRWEASVEAEALRDRLAELGYGP